MSAGDILGVEAGPLCEPLSGREWTGGAVHHQSRFRAEHYRAGGVGPGDLVFVHFGNTLEFFADLLALWSLGACVAPVDPRLTLFEIETLARAAVPRFSLWSADPPGEVAGLLAALGVTLLESPDGRERQGNTGETSWPSAQPGLDQDALVLFTSGSTGQPKGVVPAHRADLALQLGALVDEQRITFMSSVPALWRLALRTARAPRWGTLERVACGSAPLSAAMWQEIGGWAGGAPVSNVYGITETASWLAGTAPDTVPEDGLVGDPWGSSLMIVSGASGAGSVEPDRACETGEPGHVWVRTPALMRGYLGRDDLTALAVRGGWLASGDIGLLDERGRLYLRGRERDEINRGGLKVYPADIDAVVERFDETLDSCTFGYDDGLGQEEVGVAVVLRAADAGAVGRLYAWARRHLAAHQMPRRWYVVDEIPRTSRGKVNRAQVGARCESLRPVDPRALHEATEGPLCGKAPVPLADDGVIGGD